MLPPEAAGGQFKSGPLPCRQACLPFSRPRSATTLAWALLLAVLLGTAAPAQQLLADYRLQGNLSSTVGAVVPLSFTANCYFTNDVVDGRARTVAYFPAGDGLVLSNASAVLSSNYTIVLLFRFTTLEAWRRVIDFKNQTSDQGLYSFFDNLDFFNVASGSGGSVLPGTYLQVALTRDASGQVAAYVNGSLEIAFFDEDGQALLSPDNVLAFFRDDLAFPGEDAAGALARLRIYDAALSPAQVTALDRLPNVTGLQRPVITSATAVRGIVNAPFQFQVTVLNAPDNFSATGLPEWASFDNLSGSISGTPTNTGAWEVRVSANNAAGSDATSVSITLSEFTLTADRTADAPFLTIQGPVGRHYRVEYINGVPSARSWQLLTNVLAATNLLIVSDPAWATQPQRFYRAVLLP